MDGDNFHYFSGNSYSLSQTVSTIHVLQSYMLPPFSTVILAVMPVENTMKKPQHMLGCPGVLNSAMSLVTALHATIGFLGYVRYGDDVEAIITLNLPKGTLYVIPCDGSCNARFF